VRDDQRATRRRDRDHRGERRNVRDGCGVSEPTWFRRTGLVAASAAGAAWLIVMGMILRHRVFISSDTVSNYAHVWYVSRVLVRSHRIPFHMSIIGHGRGLAFPYAFIPWLTAALLRPLLGDWVVTLWLVIGSIGLVASTFWAFPELRRGWWVALVLANPFLVVAPVFGQLPFVWGMAMLFAAIACWRTERTVWAVVLAGLGQATHAAVVLPIAALLVVGWLCFEPRRRRLLLAYALSLLIALPAVWLVLITPAFTDSSLGVKVANFVDTVGPRLLVVAIPIALVLFRRVARPWMAPVLFAVSLAGSAGLAAQVETRAAWGDLSTSPERSIDPFIASAAFRPGLEYRVLTTTDRRMGMYLMIQAGARLDSEFFPESLERRTWPSAAEYCQFLSDRHVDRVLIYHQYDTAFRKNEQKLLTLLSSSDRNACAAQHVMVNHLFTGQRFEVYAITR